MKRAIAIFLCVCSAAFATDKFVDPAASGSNNGTSWANAWTALSGVTGLASGDTLYISGGSSGNTQTYTLSGELSSIAGWVNGSSGASRVTYKIGQDSSHNGTAIFHRSSQGSQWIFGAQNVIISGDAGDGAKHFKTENYNEGLVCNGKVNIRCSYVDFGNMPSTILTGNTITGLEWDHCSGTLTDTVTGDRISYCQFVGSTYDDNLIHHNTFTVPSQTDGTGADCFQFTGIGYSVYNNTLIATAATYTGGQHNDGLQDTGGSSYIKIYNNTFLNFGSYAIFLEAFTGGYTNVYVYNNVSYLTSSGVQGNAAAQGMAIGPTANSQTFTNVNVMNNLIADQSAHSSISFYQPGGITGTTFTSCTAKNNVEVNGGGYNFAAGISQASNVSMSSATAAGKFNTYSNLSASNNFRLTSSATTLIGQGADLSSFFTTDADGVTRAAPWDIGPFKYVAAATPSGRPLSGRGSRRL